MNDTEPTVPAGWVRSSRPWASLAAMSRGAVLPLPEVGFGIRVKLIALTVGTIVAIVVVLTSYFATKQIAEYRAARRDRAEVYAAMAGQQLGSAVAFDDEETAREVLTALAKDPRISGVALYADRGELLHLEGTRSDLAYAARVGFGGQARTFYLPGRVLAVAPVKSLEGPTGTVVLEASTRSVIEARQRLVRAAITVGFVAVLLGALAAWLIARSLSIRIERIASAASAMARGDLTQSVDVRGPNDEIGVLARGFNAMVKTLQELIEHIRRNAREESERLEQLVHERTVELDRKNHNLQLVLDNMDQGFVTVDRDGVVSGEYSRAIEGWLGTPLGGAPLWDVLEQRVAGVSDRFRVGWEQVVNGYLPVDVSLDQMPKQVLLDGRSLSLAYKPLGADDFANLIVVISDVTATIARERSEQEERDVISVSSHLLRDRSGFVEFFAEAQKLVERVRDNESDPVTLKRDLHTLKGNTAIYGVVGISQICHELESTLEICDPSSLDRDDLVRRWDRLREKFEPFLRDGPHQNIEVDEIEYEAAMDAVRQGAENSEIERILGAWRLEPLRLRLERAGEQLTATVQRLGKGKAHVVTIAPHIYIARQELAEFWSVFSHIIRNAAAHGLESPEVRRSVGKPEVAYFELRACLETGRLAIEITDTGPGVDWEAIRAFARARGLPSATEADLQRALFADGMSTSSEVTDTAGRGIGLSAVRAVCERQGGTIEVSTKRGRGTRFRFSWPVDRFESLTMLDVERREAAE